MSRALGLVAAALLLLAASPQDVASQVAREIMSPYCPGVTLHDCPSDEANDLRRKIVGMAEDGMSRGEIIEELEAEYGPAILATPQSPLARILPWAAAATGVVVGWLLIGRFAARERHEIDSGAAVVSDHDRRRLDAELDAFRRSEG